MKGKRVLVTGGASFISSHLVDSLIREGAEIRIADDFSSGKLENLQYPLVKVANSQWVESRATDLNKAKKLLDFSPKVSYKDGLKKTVDWYFATKKPDDVIRCLQKSLNER